LLRRRILLRWKKVEIFFIVFVLLWVVVREVLVGFVVMKMVVLVEKGR
jgi:hypothetical protein